MINKTDSCKTELNKSEGYIEDIKIINRVIDMIKNKETSAIHFYATIGEDEEVIDIYDENRDMIVQLFIELKRHHKSLLDNSLNGVINTMKDV